MTKINDTTTFPNTTPALTDHFVGTDVSNTANDANGETVTFTMQATLDLFEANFAAPAGFIDAITEIDATLKSGSDATLITGTAGTADYVAKWNADGDLVDGWALAGADATILTGTAGTDGNMAVWNADGDLVDGPDLLDEDNMASDSAADVPTQQSVKAYVDVAQVNAQTGTTYTLVLGDRGKTVTMSNASANTLTIPTNASVAFPTGTVIAVIQIGAGATTIAGDTGVTVNGVSAGSGAINTQYQGVTLTKIGTDTWVASGDIATVA